MNRQPSASDTTAEFTTSSEDETDVIGLRIANAVEPGLVIGLVGDLGAGKTRLARAIALALGAEPHAVNSPTFVLVQRYEARLPVYHFDTYRLQSPEEFEDLGPDEIFQAGGLCLIEWADRVIGDLPDDRLMIEIRSTGPSNRMFRLTASGDRSCTVLRRLVRPDG